MKISKCGLLVELGKVKVLNDKTIEDLNTIITNKDYSSGASRCPYIVVESFTGKIVNQQLIVTTYYDTNQETLDTVTNHIYTYINPSIGNINNHGGIEGAKLKFLKESILFDIYIRKTKLMCNKELIKKYKEYNDKLLENVLNKGLINEDIVSVRNITTLKEYHRFLNKVLTNPKYNL